MAVLNEDEKRAARKEVQVAIRDGRAHTITKKTLAAAVEKRLGLDEDHFNKEQRAALGDIATGILASANDAKAAESLTKSESRVASTSKTKKDKPDKNEEKGAKAEKDAAPAKKHKSDKQPYRTSEFINSEGDPVDAPLEVTDSDDENEEKPQKKKTKKSEDKPEKSKKKDNELKPKVAKAARAKEAQSPEEEEIAKLKSLVVACGVRKQWAKEFEKADATTPKSQIKHLRSLLIDLGMPSRMSLTAAREIKAKRELAKEAADLGIEAPGYKVEDTKGRASRKASAASKKAASASPPRKKSKPLKIGSSSSSNEDEEADGDSNSNTGDGRKSYAPKKADTKADSSSFDSESESDDDVDVDDDDSEL